jgi:hypothetical protein
MGDLRAAQPSEADRRSELLGRAPVAERLQTPDIAGDRFGGERGAELEEPGPQVGRRDRVDWPRRAELANGPDEDHLVPLDRPRGRALGRLGGAEQVGGGAQPDRNRA